MLGLRQSFWSVILSVSDNLKTDNLNVDQLLEQLAQQLQIFAQGMERKPLLIGIHRGGAWLAQRLHGQLQWPDAVGFLNIGFYRDDYSKRSINLSEAATLIPESVENRVVILLDDILYTGRTVRAAMNELFDYGRPAAIYLGCLIARDGRELPIDARFCGARIELPPDQVLKLRGPDPLRLELRTRSGSVLF